MKNTTKLVAHGAIMAALYVVLTLVSALLGLASGPVQFRLAEALTILPLFTPAAVPGLAIGCFLANLLTGSAFWDVVIGSLATLLGALGTRYLARGNVFLGALWPVLANVALVPPVLRFVYGVADAWPVLAGGVALGEIVCCGFGGWVLFRALVRTRLFGKNPPQSKEDAT